jgi:hypothetical protein
MASVAFQIQGPAYFRRIVPGQIAEGDMSEQGCLIDGCTARVYAPAGTGSLCKEHFVNFVTWRRRKGPGMFHKYAAMTMEERDAVTTEWRKTVKVEEAPPSPGPKR